MAEMVSPVPPENVFQPQRIKEFFLARQPILNREQQLFAYELLFRNAVIGPANVTDDIAATASVIAHASELGMENVIGASLGFINVDAAVLTSEFIRFLPKQHVVLEILETVRVTDRLLARVAELSQAGYVFALDDVVSESEDVQRLLPLADIIKVDINGLSYEELARLSSRFKSAGKKLLAEKVESLVQFQHCLDLGFDYFQGYYFARPLVLSGKKLSPSQIAVMQLMAQVVSRADITDIERSIKQDASLVLTLLRLVNTPAAGVPQRIDSLRQALEILGREQLQHWLQILLYADPGKSKGATSPLLALATSRGKLLELIAGKINPGDRDMAGAAFTVGIMSLMDALFGLPMETILERFSVADEVKQALLSRSGVYGDMLNLVEGIERINGSASTVAPLLKKLHLSVDEFYSLQLKAFEWSDTVSQSTGE
jgi:EAL and modified HD-GYP domain-containing signal transduction protein